MVYNERNSNRCRIEENAGQGPKESNKINSKSGGETEMRKLVLFMHVSLDGYASDSNWRTRLDSVRRGIREIRRGGRSRSRSSRLRTDDISHDGELLAHRAGQSECVETRYGAMPDGCRMLRRSSFPATMDKVEWNNTMLIKDNIAEEITGVLKSSPAGKISLFSASPGAAKTLA